MAERRSPNQLPGGDFVFAEEAEVVEGDGEDFVVVEVALEDFGSAAGLVFVDFFFFFLGVEFFAAGDVLFLIEGDFHLGLALFKALNALDELGEIGRLLNPLRGAFLELREGSIRDVAEAGEPGGRDAIELDGIVEIAFGVVDVVGEGRTRSARTPRFCVLSPLGR